MPYRLKSIELNGYKTFANKSEFEFAENITAIVGPNGSGKSNIADALRWVLGEQSYSLLRGRKTDDMIFAGSNTRPQAGMASVTLIFDNSDGWLPIDFSEVSVTRRAYRDGQNEYLINNQKVRLKDVNELLSQSGLSERTYTVIGQGLVDVALSLNSAERRRLFEEAAGIGLYRTRKEQSLRRLEKTKRNLERVEDILAELKPRLRSLKTQSRRAQEYNQVKEDLKEVLREWYGYHWHKAQEDLKNAREVALHQTSTLEKSRSNHEMVTNKFEKTRENINSLRGNLAKWHKELAELHTQREEINRNLAVGEERQRSIVEMESSLLREKNLIEVEKNLNQDRNNEAQAEVERISQLVAESEEKVIAVQRSFDARIAERGTIESEIESLRNKLAELNTKQIDREAQRLSFESQIEALQAEDKILSDELLKSGEELDQLNKMFEHSQEELEKAVAHLSQLERESSDIEVSLESSRVEHAQKRSTLASLQGELSGLISQIEVIDQAESNLTGYASGVQMLLAAAQDKKISSKQGALSKHLEIPSNLEVAIAAAIGEYADAILLENTSDSEKALDILQNQAGRAALLPLSSLTSQKPLGDVNDPDCVGVASKLVKAPNSLKPAVDLLLGQILVVKNRNSALRILKGQSEHVKAVTLAGELFHKSGMIFVDSKGGSGLLARPRRRKELAAKLVKQDKAILDLAEHISKIETEIAKTQSTRETLVKDIEVARRQVEQTRNTHQAQSLNLERTSNQIEWQKTKKAQQSAALETAVKSLQSLSEGKGEVDVDMVRVENEIKERAVELNNLPTEDRQQQVSHWNTQLAVNKQTLDEALKRQNEREAVLAGIALQETSLSERFKELEDKKENLTSNMQSSRGSEGDLGKEFLSFQALINPAEAELKEVDTEHEGAIVEERKAREELSVAERHNAQAQIALSRKQESLEVLRGKVEDDFGLVEFEYDAAVSGPKPLPFGDLVERLPHVEELNPDLNETLKLQRTQLRRMGSVNPEAQIEYDQVQERFDFLTTQLEDLSVAEKDVREVIAELDSLMEREFRKTFDTVASEFRQIFSRLFGGGSAKLILTEGDNFSETGVDIETRLPGKRAQRLALLSGGERSLTATALVFSLLKASPTPFCVLDEVDAMLDEANIGRFRDLLLEFSKNTQFVLITHNRNTVQAADVIYGITMGRDTASQVISLNLDEVDDRFAVGAAEAVN